MKHGYRVLGPVGSVAEALQLLVSDTPDIAVLDVNLNGEPVTPVAEALRAKAVPFLLASAYGGKQLSAPILATVPNVGKPMDEHRLLAALTQALAP